MTIGKWRISERTQIVAVLIVVSILLFNALGKTPIYILDEARNAQCAREMLLRNDWVVPTFNEELRVQKPPLHYYAMMLAYKLFGVNAFAARFFSALLGVLLIAGTYIFLKKIKGHLVAILSVLILAASTHWLFEFRLAVPDPFLIFFFTLTLYFLYGYFVKEKVALLYLSAILMALAVLAKGPVALGLAGMPALVWLIWEKKTRLLWRPQTLLAAVLFLIITLPWYLLVHQQTQGAFTNGFFVEQNLNRFNESMEGHGGWFILVPLFVWGGLLPFSPFVIEAAKRVKVDLKDPLSKYVLLITLWVLFIFGIAETKLPNYPMLCYPFVAIWLANWAAKVYQDQKIFKNYPVLILALLYLVLGVALFFALDKEPAFQSYKWWAILFVATSLASIFAYRQLQKRQLVNGLLLLLGVFVVFNALFLGVLYPSVYQNNPVTQSLPIIKGKKLYAYGLYNPSFNFHTNGSITQLQDAAAIKAMWRLQPDALVVSRQDKLADLDPTFTYQLVFTYKDIFEIPTTVILKNPEQ